MARIDQPLPEIDVVIEGARILLRKYAGPVASMMVDDVLDGSIQNIPMVFLSVSLPKLLPPM